MGTSRLRHPVLAICAAAIGACSLPMAKGVVGTVTSRIGPDGKTYLILGTVNGPNFDGVTWNAGETAALALGGHLATVTNLTTDDWLWNSISPLRNDFWIGLNSVATPGTYVWSSDIASSYTNWGPGQPNTGNSYTYLNGSPTWATADGSANDPYAIAQLATAPRFDWNLPAGGSFSSAGSWNPAAIPSTSDGAYFSLAATYTTTFGGAVTNTIVAAERGSPTLSLGNNAYTVTEAYVGTLAGQSPVLSVRGGGTGKMRSNYTTLGLDSGMTGTLAVGSGASYSNAQDFYVGLAGNGNLSISAGGAVTIQNLQVGYLTTASGSIAVSGAGTALTTTGAFNIGWYGSGSMSVGNGATVTVAGLAIAHQRYSTGALTISGAGTLLTSTGGISVSDLAGSHGSLQIDSGAHMVVVLAPLALGADEAAASGTLRVTGAGSDLNVGFGITVGDVGGGDLRIDSGATATFHDFSIGNQWPGHGTATIDGAGSLLTVTSGGPSVGGQGSGIMTVQNGGRVNGVQTQIGAATTAFGSLIVTGTGSNYTGSSDLVVGNSGTGLLNVAAGPTIQAADLQIGANTSGFGSASIDGVGTLLKTTSGDNDIGYNAHGALAITNGASVQFSDGSLMAVSSLAAIPMVAVWCRSVAPDPR